MLTCSIKYFANIVFLFSASCFIFFSKHISAEGVSFNQSLTEVENIRTVLAQKIVLDFRYYCDGATETITKYSNYCSTPMTQLPDELSQMIQDSNLGGVILFSENLQNTHQIVKLTYDLQQSAVKSSSQLPLFISIDQEGGRVARLPRRSSTSFSGNMAIGATYQKWGTKYATVTGNIIGRELEATGFNVNFAPTLDVNSNPNNPVINVRSFSDNAATVGELGLAQLSAMQQHHVISTLKHFPGHGDTSVDSHTGLPVVKHSLNKAISVDLAPFQYVIDNGQVDMIMTAHIQYPELDSSTFVSKSGKTMIKPATMSQTIISELLRDKMKYKGIVITDALDMKGITEFFTETEAVIETFNAGVDIALMPVKIRKPQDITKLSQLLDELETAVNTGRLNEQKIRQSFQRIHHLKNNKLMPSTKLNTSLQSKLSIANKTLKNAEHIRLEQQLSDRSITVLKGQGKLTSSITKLLAFMPDTNKCAALQSGFNSIGATQTLTCYAYYDVALAKAKELINQYDGVLLSNITPVQSLVEMGGAEDWPKMKHKFGSIYKNKRRQDYVIKQLLIHAKQKLKPTTFVSLRMPYEVKKYQQYADNVIVTYGYNQYVELQNNRTVGVVYTSLSKLLTGKMTAQGDLPIKLGVNIKE